MNRYAPVCHCLQGMPLKLKTPTRYHALYSITETLQQCLIISLVKLILNNHRLSEFKVQKVSHS